MAGATPAALSLANSMGISFPVAAFVRWVERQRNPPKRRAGTAVDVFRLPQPILRAGALHSLATNSGVRRDGIAAGTRKEKNEPEAGNLLGTALNPCQNFGMFVRTAMLSHCGGHGSGGRDPPAGLVAATRHASRDGRHACAKNRLARRLSA